ncbi:MAG TPA: hypothetical protein VE783_00170 [Candidatus Limnocylindrales bacterium]|nr:hypothetical protein [Candidatus Limnocylindrales bacterium]
MGAALIITAGVLMLLQSNGVVRMEQSWPVVLLVVGAFSFLGHTASIEGHVQPYGAGPAQVPPQPWAGVAPVQQPSPTPWSSGEMPAATTTTSTSSEQNSPNNSQVQNP